MLLEVTTAEFNTILGALRYYQENGMGEPSKRSDWIQEIVCPTADDTSLSADEIDALCERLNCEPPAIAGQLLAALERASAACDTADWIGQAEQAIADAYLAGLGPIVSADLKRLIMAEIDNVEGEQPATLETVRDSLAGGYEPCEGFPVAAVKVELDALIVERGNAPAERFVTVADWQKRAKSV